jgi:starch synthase
VYPPERRSYAGDDGHVLNLSKAAMMNADRILTVSPGYAEEMKTQDGGFGLPDVVKMREFWMAGILNGIDVAHWNPKTDPLLAEKYGPNTNFLVSRATCKKQLQERLNLRVNPDIAVVSFVGRLAHQKGLDIILEAIDWLMTDTGNGVTGKVQLILMGHGDSGYGEGLRSAENKYKGLVCGYVGFDPDVEHMIYGGSDLFLMPSRYEPCGLPQMYAMRYGCVPIVTLCGGLKDSVITEPPEEATGFGISPLTVNKFKEVTYQALAMFLQEPEKFRAMQLRGMKKDFSWCRALDKYEQHIDWSLADQPYKH